jgi:hypothetical protein
MWLERFMNQASSLYDIECASGMTISRVDLLFTSTNSTLPTLKHNLQSAKKTKKGKELDDVRRQRSETTLKIRKEKKDSQLSKRRNPAGVVSTHFGILVVAYIILVISFYISIS